MAIQKIEGLPDSVVAFEASGKVTDADYRDHIMPAVEACQKTAVKALGFAMPVEMKVFDLSELDAAKAWVVA